MQVAIILALWTTTIGFCFSDQQVLEQQLTPASMYDTAVDLLQRFKVEEKDFAPLDYGKILREEEPDPKPVVGVDVDFSEELEWRIYAKRMANLDKDQVRAIELLTESSEANSLDSTSLLADINMFGNYSIPRNGSLALKYYERLSRITSDNGNAHYMLGFIYATGLFGEVEQNQAKALMHYQASHEAGNLKATMVLAYRYYQGISVERNCGLALFYYSTIAQKSLQYITEGPIGGPNIDSYSVRIADFSGGLYGTGASEQHSSLTRAGDNHIFDRSVFNEINIDPDIHRSVRLYYEANAYYNADYFHKRDYAAAFAVASQCAAEGEDMIKWSGASAVDKMFVSRCYSLLGHMYLRGEGTTQNYSEALKWLTRASEIHSKPSYQVDLGLIYEYGLGLDAPNPVMAKAFYQRSQKESEAAKFHLARQYMNEGQIANGFELMQLAAYGGSEEALFHLSTLYERGIGGKKSCEDNVAAYKAFVERIEPVISPLEWAFKKFFCEGDNKLALIGYAMAAEQGYETAQSSAGYLLYAPVPIAESLPRLPLKRYEAAITYYSRSSRQYNIDSTVFLGDLYYYGVLSPELGNDSVLVHPDYKKAFHYYQDASNKHSRQGSFNLGYMYEQGLGVPKDYHLAKRYYDLALLGKSSDLYLPVQMALIKLKAKMFWNRLIGGVGVEDESEAPKPTSRSWNDWKDLYKSIKRTNRVYLMEDAQESDLLQQLANENGVEEFDYEILDSGIFDLVVLAAILLFVGTAIYYHYRARRRRDGPEGENNNQGAARNPNFQFNFVVIPL